MKLYEINGLNGMGHQRHFVVAHSIGEAEKTYTEKYGYSSINRIEVISPYILISGTVIEEVLKETEHEI